MKKISFIVLFIQVLCMAQKIETVSIDSEIMDGQRELLVYTPFDYGDDPLRVYDVIFVFDAQNRDMFDLAHSLLSFMDTNGAQYVVVGVVSPFEKRNNDLLPVQKTKAYQEKWGAYAGNADNFVRFVREEAIPYIGSHYSVSGTRIAIGHSNSAAFILYSFIKDARIFSHYIAISPNLCNDEDALVGQFESYDYKTVSGEKFLYISNANEETIKGWQAWKPARKKFYDFLNRSEAAKAKLNVVIKSYPEEGHWNTYLPSLQNGLTEYFAYTQRKDNTYSAETYDVTVLLTVPNEDDVVYITGNQPELGNWDPGKIRMNRKSAFERTITLKMHNPAQFKFTKGNWETEGLVRGFAGNLKVDVTQSSVYTYTISGWNE